MRSAALRNPLFHRALGLVLGAVFVYASIDKIANPADFARIVYHYQVVGPNGTLGFVPANAVAVALPWVEALSGCLLLLGLWRREAAGVCALLLAVFIVAVGSTMVRGIDVENCGCFRVEEGRPAGWGLIAGDLGLLAVALFVAFWPSDTRAGIASASSDARVLGRPGPA